ncbi:MAG TPA: hypothetical protein VGF40_11065 [Thermoanaerobaculia bacterium]
MNPPVNVNAPVNVNGISVRSSRSETPFTGAFTFTFTFTGQAAKEPACRA